MRMLALQRRSYVGLEFPFVTLYVGSATAAECGFVVEWLSLDRYRWYAVERAISRGWLRPRRTLMRLSVPSALLLFCCFEWEGGRS
jgi:hypothetical protein